jgi:hypothetical protein
MLEERATSEEYAGDNFTGFLLRMLRYDDIDGVHGLVQLFFLLHIGEEN